MQGVTDAPMRAYQGARGGFSFAVTEFIRVSQNSLPAKIFLRDVPELRTLSRTVTGLPVQVQILGGDPELMAETALAACRAGAIGIDINFGCPAPTVNRHDGGASLLRSPCRLKAIVQAVRTAVPATIPVSAKLRLGWDDIDDIFETAHMAEEGGADWITIHARTRVQGYEPPVHWGRVGEIRRELTVPVVANGDIWSVSDLLRCQDETGCIHFMLGRGALADPFLSIEAAHALGISEAPVPEKLDWRLVLNRFVAFSEQSGFGNPNHILSRLKQWLCLAGRFGDFRYFRDVKKASSLDELFAVLALLETLEG